MSVRVFSDDHSTACGLAIFLGRLGVRAGSLDHVHQAEVPSWHFHSLGEHSWKRGNSRLLGFPLPTLDLARVRR